MCIIAGCSKAVSAKGLCKTHYQNQYNKRYQKSPRYQEIVRQPKALFQSARSHAERRGTNWDITLEEFEELCTRPCFWCKRYFSETGSGLDRQDPRAGYTLDNVERCCGKCNYLRGKFLSVAEMRALVALLITMRGGALWSTD